VLIAFADGEMIAMVAVAVEPTVHNFWTGSN